MDYSAIIVARNEEQFIDKVLQSLINQTILPHEIILVDDGSEDQTSEKAISFMTKTAELDRLRVIVRTNRGFNAIGTRLMADVFNDGFGRVDWAISDLVLILGADTTLDPDYMQKIIQETRKNSRLAITCGWCPDEPWIGERHVHGSSRVILAKFFKKMNFRYPANSAWESTAMVLARALGYETYYISTTNSYRLRVGGVRRSNYFWWGVGVRELGYHWAQALFRFVSVAKNMGVKPAIQMTAGYLSPERENCSNIIRDYMRTDGKHRLKLKLMKILP